MDQSQKKKPFPQPPNSPPLPSPSQKKVLSRKFPQIRPLSEFQGQILQIQKNLENQANWDPCFNFLWKRIWPTKIFYPSFSLNFIDHFAFSLISHDSVTTMHYSKYTKLIKWMIKSVLTSSNMYTLSK